jgi:hypothetical protein
MTKAKRIRARVGDVFVVPVSEDLQVYGQVIDQAGFQFLVILFRSTSGPLEEVMRSGIELAGIVFDAKWRNGDWPILANYPPPKTTSPWFVSGHEKLGNLRLVTFDGTITRTVTAADASKHQNRTIANAMALQIAAEAVHHRREWTEALDPFRDLAAELASAGDFSQ